MDTKAMRARCDVWPYDIGQAKEDVAACLDHIEAQNKLIEEVARKAFGIVPEVLVTAEERAQAAKFIHAYRKVMRSRRDDVVEKMVRAMSEATVYRDGQPHDVRAAFDTLFPETKND